jgi:hypothetical protein
VRHRVLGPAALSRRLATAQSDHDGRRENPREGCAALVLVTAVSAGLKQFGSGRRGCQCHDTHHSQRDPASRFSVGLAEFGQQSVDALGGALMAVDFALPASLSGVVGELGLDAEAFAEPRGVLGGGDELGAGQVEVAFARAFLGQAQAVAEFQLGLVEVGLEPVQGVLSELPGAQGVGQGGGRR